MFGSGLARLYRDHNEHVEDLVRKIQKYPVKVPMCLTSRDYLYEFERRLNTGTSRKIIRLTS